MAYFHCLIGGGSSGGGYELTVTCDADFAGTTITCTDGVTTLTQTCPSASPYEVVFEIPNGGDWTISGVVGGHTVSTGVNIPTSAELIATVQQTVTIHSAKEDTISYTDIDGATQTITFASGETSKQVTIAIESSGNSITFTSSIAKNPNNLSQDYSKTFTITTSTTEIYLMPDAVKTLYWWGYESNNLEDCSSANGWSLTSSTYSFITPTHNIGNIYLNCSSHLKVCGVGCKQIVSKDDITSLKAVYQTGANLCGYNTKVAQVDSNYSDIGSSATMDLLSLNKPSTDKYIFVDIYSESGRTATGTLYAFWYE